MNRTYNINNSQLTIKFGNILILDTERKSLHYLEM